MDRKVEASGRKEEKYPYKSMGEAPGPTTNHGQRLLPPTHFTFGTLLFREFVFRLEKLGYFHNSTKSLHAAVFRRYVRRLVDSLDPNHPIDWDAFGGVQQRIWLQWEDIRPGVVSQAIAPMRTSVAERLMLVMEDTSSCILAVVYKVVIFLAIICSVSLVVVQSLHDICPKPKLNEPRCFNMVEVACVMVFSVDYGLKLICVPLARNAVYDKDWHFANTVADPLLANTQRRRARMSRWGRFQHYFFKPMSIIDLIAILPFWLKLLVDDLLPFPLAFLRGLRLLRFFRVMKFGRFNSTLTVLGTVLARSTQAVYVLLIYIALTSLVAGAIFQQVERNIESFETVPSATWWVFSRMVAMQHSSSWTEGRPETMIGGALLAFLLILKGIIWILPFGQIGNTFREAWAESEDLKKLQLEVQVEDAKNPERVWVEDGESPTVVIAVWEDSAEDLGSDSVSRALSESATLAGRGTVPLPILEKTPSQAVVTTVIWGGSMQPWYTVPTMDFLVEWVPVKVKDGASQGSLKIKPLQGENFLGRPGTTWRVSVTDPSRLYGSSDELWWSQSSAGGAPCPTWENSSEANFDVCWEAGRAESKETPAPKVVSTEEEVLRRVLQLVQENGQRLEELHSANNTSASIIEADSKEVRRKATDSDSALQRVLQLVEAQGQRLEELSRRTAAIEKAIATKFLR